MLYDYLKVDDVNKYYKKCKRKIIGGSMEEELKVLEELQLEVLLVNDFNKFIINNDKYRKAIESAFCVIDSETYKPERICKNGKRQVIKMHAIAKCNVRCRDYRNGCQLWYACADEKYLKHAWR